MRRLPLLESSVVFDKVKVTAGRARIYGIDPHNLVIGHRPVLEMTCNHGDMGSILNLSPKAAEALVQKLQNGLEKLRINNPQCKKHRTYKVIYKPRVDCEDCWKMWRKANA